MSRPRRNQCLNQLEPAKPIFAVPVELGDSVTVDEIRDNGIKKLKFPGAVVDEPHR